MCSEAPPLSIPLCKGGTRHGSLLGHFHFNDSKALNSVGALWHLHFNASRAINLVGLLKNLPSCFSSQKTLRHHLSSKSKELRFIQRFEKHIRNLMISWAVFEFHFFVNDFLLLETKSHFIMLRIPNMFDPSICLGDTGCIIFCNLQSTIIFEQFKVFQ